ncbi:MAG TPA: ubiquinol-cytochrome c reductase iron-sulfur subunit [Candidatus Dormibacteraeota bacterium]|nr:ubiquinol-cytochrome c reductase iron-sulfur subunit [Candidatus Dormibacteraeota bacterium]
MKTSWEQHNQRQPPGEYIEDKRVLEGRRSFFLWLVGIGTATMGALLSIPLLRYALYPVFAKTTSAPWSKLGSRNKYASLTVPVREVVDIEQVNGWMESVSQKPVYVTKGNRKGAVDGVEVLSAVCPHLGCEVPWNADAGKFVCPCHGSVFASDGSLIQGPALRGMDTLAIQMEEDALMVRYEYFQALLPDKKVVG